MIFILFHIIHIMPTSKKTPFLRTRKGGITFIVFCLISAPGLTFGLMFDIVSSFELGQVIYSKYITFDPYIEILLYGLVASWILVLGYILRLEIRRPSTALRP